MARFNENRAMFFSNPGGVVKISSDSARCCSPRIGILWGLALAALVTGCSERQPDRGQADAAPSSEPVAGGTAVVALASEPDGLNPLVFASASAGLVFAEMHDGLTEMDDALNYVARIAHSWQVGADDLSITYAMRRWLWADGRLITAFDVARSFDLFVAPEVASPRRGRLREVSSAVALDSFTVRYTFGRPQADPLARSWHHILPMHVVGELDPAHVASWPINARPVSSGPFQLETWERSRSLTLVRNPHYSGTPARLDRVVFRILPEADTRLVALEAGEVDLVSGLDPDAARRLADSGRATIVSVGGRRFYYLSWNLGRDCFADTATRQALSLALNRELMLATLLKGYGQPANSPIPPVLWNHHGDLPAARYDPDGARELLAAAGWRDSDGDGVLERDGEEFRFEIITKQGDPVREHGAVILRANLADVGVKVTLRVMDHAASLAQVRAGRFDAYLGLLNANLFGNPAPYVASDATDQLNFGHYANATVDSLLQVATSHVDRAEALPDWLRLQEVLAEDPPAAYLMYPDNLVAVSKRLRDVKPHLLSPVNNLVEWWIAPEERIYRTGH
jgi:peptide/nickel transport system substrate-binding protein